nr:hypothetical protein [Candidatus Delongbacteria bacterium]
MNNFKLSRNQDAYPTIRGFTYQVKITILRWLDLKSEEILELECGEDIDYICENYRKLEQIKHRNKRITLNSDCSKEAVFNYYNHLKTNRSNNIKFLFITNANVTKEKRSNYLKELSGIDLWNEMNSFKLEKDHIQIGIQQIKNTIINYKKIKSDKNALFTQWKLEIKKKNITFWKKFILNFEWLTNFNSFNEIDELLKSKIKDKYVSSNADTVYNKLFVYVFSILSKQGKKTLNIDDLVGIMQKELSEQDKEIFLKFCEFDSKLKIISDRICKIENKGLLSKNRLKELCKINLEEYKNEISFNASKIIERNEYIEEFNSLIYDESIIFLKSYSGFGKSTLAFQILSKYINSGKIGIRVHQNTIENNSVLLSNLVLNELKR